jgi:hypothetical protein
MQVLSNVVQLIGAIVTWLGLWHAYTRAKYGLGLWPWIKSKLRRRGPDQTITSIGIPGGEAFGHTTISGDGYVSFTLDTTKPVEDQLGQLAIHMHKLDAMFPSIRQDLIRLDRAMADARQHAETVASQALRRQGSHWPAVAGP